MRSIRNCIVVHSAFSPQLCACAEFLARNVCIAGCSHRSVVAVVRKCLSNIRTSPSLLSRVPTRMPTSTPWTSQSKKVSSATTPAVSSQILATNSRGPFQTASYDADVSWKQSPVSKRKKQEMSDAFQGALINALKEPTTQITDPLDGFVCRLAEGMRRLPYCERARLEITFLTLLAEKEELCNNRNMEPRY